MEITNGERILRGTAEELYDKQIILAKNTNTNFDDDDFVDEGVIVFAGTPKECQEYLQKGIQDNVAIWVGKNFKETGLQEDLKELLGIN